MFSVVFSVGTECDSVSAGTTVVVLVISVDGTEVVEMVQS